MGDDSVFEESRDAKKYVGEILQEVIDRANGSATTSVAKMFLFHSLSVAAMKIAAALMATMVNEDVHEEALGKMIEMCEESAIEGFKNSEKYLETVSRH